MRSACIFCGATDRKIDNEHVWSNWTKKYVPGGNVIGDIASRSSKSGTRQWRARGLDSKVRVPCKTCNNTWMSSVDGAAAPLVGPMIAGESVTVGAAAQHAVASWCVLKGLIVSQVTPHDAWIPENHFCAVYEAKGVPADTVRVWLSRRDSIIDPTSPATARRAVGDVIPQRNVDRPVSALGSDAMEEYLRGDGALFATVLQLGHFVGVSVHHDWPGMEVRPAPTKAGALSFLPVWPAASSGQWPPLLPIDGLGNPHLITEYFMMAPPGTPVRL